MSPLHLRRYRAERLLQRQFDGLRGRVLATVRQRLSASGLALDQCDLDAAYAQAWQGLYAATLDGQHIANPAGWLMLVTFRRAIEHHRAQHHEQPTPELNHHAHALNSSHAADLDAELDHRTQLQQLFEGISSRLTPREREAATLCYLHGLSRAQAAAHMGITDARMRKLMEGRGPGRPGVASKVGALVHTIRQGDWCHEQGSLMRALAYGILDPQGQRYQLALTHHRQCPACRAYVVSLRGLAAALPPVFLPSGIAAAVLARVAHGIHAGGAGAAGGASAGSTAGSAGASGVQAGRALGGAVSASGAAGAGGAAAGGGWLIGAGPLTAKLAAGCLLALGLGAGCVALDNGHHSSSPPHRSHLPAQPDDRLAASSLDLSTAPLSTVASSAAGAPAGRASTPLTPAVRASREFGPEQALAAAHGAQQASDSRSLAAVAASARAGGGGSSGNGGGGGGGARAAGSAAAAASASTGDSAAAEREFSPG